jgi:hypothetical protein
MRVWKTATWSGRGAGEKDRAVFLDAGDKVIGCEIKNPS